MHAAAPSHRPSVPVPETPVRVPAPRCALFCRVVDNFGDAGVCWRLARQLAREHGWKVRLYIDVPAVLQAFLPAYRLPTADAAARTYPVDDATASKASDAPSTRHDLVTVDGVDILPWPGLTVAGEARTDGVVWPEGADPGDIVIEAFACDLPEPVLLAMAARNTAPIWINLEYLSAEGWVNDCHLMPSRHPRLGLEKTFFFPGVRPGTGGVLRERDLGERRRHFLQDPDAQDALWSALGLRPPASDQLLITLFAYENGAMHPLLDAWSDPIGTRAQDVDIRWRGVTVFVPQGRISPQVARFFGRDQLEVGETLRRGALTVHAIPFVAQDDYDRLLWLADVNFVRGEDSFVRAQWAERPFVWHIYPQDDAAHLPKLEAALDAYIDGARLSDPAAAALRAIWQGWNEAEADATMTAALSDDDWRQRWQNGLRHLAPLRDGAAAWAVRLQAPGDLASNLARFCAEKRVLP